MNISQVGKHGLDQSQQFYRQYGANALLPEIQWNELFQKETVSRLRELCIQNRHFESLDPPDRHHSG